MKEYLNVGCAKRFHPDWTNLDFKALEPNVIEHNLLEGIPFKDESFEVVYHSHVLEHFTKEDGLALIKECNRVLKKGGIIRIVVPDLEMIVREYLSNLEGALGGNNENKENYEWIILELLDQIGRNKSGGAMAKYWFQEKIPNEPYLTSRMGFEFTDARKAYLERKNRSSHTDNTTFTGKIIRYLKFLIAQLYKRFQSKNEELENYIRIGKFRLGGQIHQWMYDRYSLSKLLTENGFDEVLVTDAFSSKIPNWNKYMLYLDVEKSQVRKPDSIFIEARKK